LTPSPSTPSPVQVVRPCQGQYTPLAYRSMHTPVTLSPHRPAQQHAPTCLSLRHPPWHLPNHPASLRRPHGQYSRLNRVVLPRRRRRGGSASAVGHPRQALTVGIMQLHRRPSSSRSARTASRPISTTCRSRSAGQTRGGQRSSRRACETSENEQKPRLPSSLRGWGWGTARASCFLSLYIW
jgi:hypothetical protein